MPGGAESISFGKSAFSDLLRRWYKLQVLVCQVGGNFAEKKLMHKKIPVRDKTWTLLRLPKIGRDPCKNLIDWPEYNRTFPRCLSYFELNLLLCFWLPLEVYQKLLSFFGVCFSDSTVVGIRTVQGKSSIVSFEFLRLTTSNEEYRISQTKKKKFALSSKTFWKTPWHWL